MTGTWRPLALAAALIVTLAAAATAQTVIVTKTTPGTSVSVGINATPVGTGTSDGEGVASVPLNTLAASAKDSTAKTEMDVRVFVDVCEKARSVWLIETGWQPPAAGPGCVRHELFGTFSVRNVTTLVVDAGEEVQSVWIRQGNAPAHWLDPNAAPEPDKPEWPMATGFVVFGGGGIGTYAAAEAIACGTGTECNSSHYRFTTRVGGEFWFGRFLAATGSYTKPYKMEAAGSGSGYRFTTTFAPNIATIGGKGGLPFGRFRLYAESGGTYQRSNLQTIQTMDSRTVTVNDEPTTFPGGTQEFNLQTSGWSWYMAGGVEVWLKKRLGMYFEGGRVSMLGDPIAGGEGALNDRVVYLLGGLRFRVSK
jgi:hypothetical protein